jgi:alanyl-tRNA synthetase
MLKIPLGTTVKSFQIANSLTSLNQCNTTSTLAASSRRFLLAPTTSQTNVYSQQERCFSNQRSSKTGFFQELVDNVKQGFEKNKELKQSIKQFREEAKKLEQSDALKEARSKFVSNF